MVISINSHGISIWRGKEIDLPPKERAVLALLVKYAPIAISKDEIIREVWVGGQSVSDDSLTRCISQIRKMLPGIRIESVYGYGYRLASQSIYTANLTMNSSAIPLAALEQFQYATSLVQQHVNKSLIQAISVLRSIVNNYPQFVLAKIGLARAIITVIGIGAEEKTNITIQEALDNLDAANDQAPYLPDLKATQAWLYDITWDFDKAEKLHLEVLSKTPDSAEYLLSYALHRMVIGKIPEAIGYLRRVLLLKPYSIHARSLLARLLGMERRYEEALHEIAITEEHSSFLPNPVIEGVKLMVTAAYAPSPRLAISAKKLEQQKNEMPPYARICVPYVLTHCGKLEEAKRWVATRHPERPRSATENVFLAKDLVAIGEFDLAAHKLKSAFQTPYGYLPFALNFPELQPVFNHPLVKEIRQGLGSPSRNSR